MAVVLFHLASSDRLRAQAQSFEGQRIAAINFDPVKQPVEGRELFELLPIKRGQPYHADQVRGAIERLYATGRYRDIQVDAASVKDGLNDGVRVTFLTKSAWFIGDIDVQWSLNDPPNVRQIVNASRLDLGQPFNIDMLKPAAAGVKRLLVHNGFFDASVDAKVEYDDTYQEANITLVIDSGKRARYAQPSITGDTSILTEKTIVKATRWRKFLVPGFRTITQNRTRSGIENVRLRYEKADRLLATVVLDGMEEQSPEGAKHPEAKPRITVNPGPKVDVTAVGAKVSRKQLRQNVPIYEEHTVDADLLSEGAANLHDTFQAEGYFEAEVEFKQQQIRNGKAEIDYLINLGRRHRFVDLQIDGAKYFAQKTLRERMFLAPKSFEFRRGRYSEAFRRRDEQAIADLYRSNGFRDVSVTSRSVDDYKGKSGDIAVFFTIAEGPQYFVGTLRISGQKQLDLSQTVSRLSSQQGQPFSEFNVAQDRATIEQVYYESGFANVTFEWNSSPGAQPHTVDLSFVINEGSRKFVREVVTTGLSTTRPALVGKQIELNPGDPLSPTRMAETQRKLYDLGIFASVDMAIQNPDGDESRKYVLFDMEEASRYSVTGGFGAEFARIGGNNALNDLSDPGGATGVSPRVSLDVSRLNFLGLGHTISVRTRYSTLQKRGILNYVAPRVRDNPNLQATYSLLFDDTRDVRTFQARRLEGSLQLSQRLSKPTTVFYRFTYRDVRVSNLKIDPLLLPRIAQSVRVGLTSFNYIQDRRDDPTDAHKGIYNTLDAGFASRIFGSQTSFVRLLGRNATYYRLGEKLVLARETQVGIAPAFSIPSSADPSDPIPLPERFFGGGGNTLRGFPDNQAGPRDLKTGFPLGGSALFFNNTELRFPVLGANVNGVLFHDAGNIYSKLSAVSFRVSQRDPTDFNYMVHAVGFGIRYRTPVGPLRIDLAYSINPPAYNGFPGNYVQLVQCSAAGNCRSALQHISHFQFFFSIGQAF